MLPTNTRIKKLRKALDLTQREFADRLGMKPNTIATYELGRANPSGPTINNICKEFRVNEEWLRHGTGEMFLPAPRDAIDDLIEQYGLPREFRSLIAKFLDLNPEQRDTVVEYMRSVAAALMADSSTAAELDAHALYEAEARAKAEEYYRELMQEREQTDEPSASPTIGADYDDLLA